jgi:hypothetical protein
MTKRQMLGVVIENIGEMGRRVGVILFLLPTFPDGPLSFTDLKLTRSYPVASYLLPSRH